MLVVKRLRTAKLVLSAAVIGMFMNSTYLVLKLVREKVVAKFIEIDDIML
jgi:hypothetical protein